MTHINQRRDTAAAWTAANPVLQAGERGYETNTRKSKTGDGVTPWNSLGYEVSGFTATKADVGLGAADNTSDEDKPVSDATQAALDFKAPLASPALTGTPTAPTPAPGDNDTSLATTAFVQVAVAAALLAAFPVNSIKMTADNVNPGTYLGGTWVPWGSGRVAVGVDAAQSEFDTAEETGGSKTHSHTLSDAAWAQIVMNTGGVLSSRRLVGITIPYNETFRSTGAGSTATPTTGMTNATPLDGATDSNASLPPYITCYMWKRTA